MKKIDVILLTLILLIALTFRLYKIDTPLADMHSWRQADTAAVARNFVNDGFTMTRPIYDDLSSIQTGLENPEGLRFVEFPIYNAIFAFFYRYLPIVSLDIYGRLTSALFSLITIAVVYYFGLKEHSRVAAAAGALSFAIMPFFVFFSRVILPESTAVSFMFMSLFFTYVYLNQKKPSKKSTALLFGLGVITYAMSILVKPTTIFYSLAHAYLFIRKYEFEVFKKWQPYVFGIIGLVPFILWRVYISQYPEGIPASAWLITMVNTFEGPKRIFFTPAFFRWIFMERLGIAMLGIYGSLFLLVGVMGKYKSYFTHVIFASAIIYLFTFQGGNVQHEYYQTIIFPAIALMMGMGVGHIIKLSEKDLNKFIAYPTVIAVFAASFLFAFYKVKDYYYIPQDLPQIARLIQTFTLPDDKIVTDRSGDTTLLYLADRKGAPAIYKSIPELKSLGYSYIVTAQKQLTQELKDSGYNVLVENDQFSIIKL
ncbi:MAG: ArnT family glycosyltransferase [Weeksellaceae bacterium]